MIEDYENNPLDAARRELLEVEQGADSGTNYPQKNFLKSNGNLLSILIRRLQPQSGMWSKAIVIRKPVTDLANTFLS